MKKLQFNYKIQYQHELTNYQNLLRNWLPMRIEKSLEK